MPEADTGEGDERHILASGRVLWWLWLSPQKREQTMTNTHKPISDDQKAAENKTDASAELKDSQLDKVGGGALKTAAKGG